MNDELYFIDEADNNLGRCLVIKAPWSEDFIEIINRENISVLRLTESMGWSDKDLSFLQDLSDIPLRGIEIYSWDIKDLTPLSFMPSIEGLGLQCQFTKAPDFSEFTNLKNFKCFWRPKAKTVFGCKSLKVLNIVNWSEENIEALGDMTRLERLQLTSRKLVSLNGIESLQSLKILDLADCTKLRSVDGIESCQDLTTIEFEACKKIEGFPSLSRLNYLRTLILRDCGKIASLKPIEECTSLETVDLSGDTVIEDGNLSPLLQLPRLNVVRFQDRKHYSHKSEEIMV